MDYFYDGQIRRYVTQFMRVFIGFKYQAGNELKSVPVLYGDMTRQVAAIIKENSENKLPNVPRIACYMSGLELDTSRLADSTFISKVNIRERRYDEDSTGRQYQNNQGGGYTVERLMPTPFKFRMKADIWTSSTDQKLQLMEQLLVLFNPSLEIQTTDNYIDWTSLSVLDLKNINISSRTVPQGVDTEIDICTIEFEMPIWLTPPAKVKKLGIVQSIISNVFTETGDIVDLENLIYNKDRPAFRTSTNDYKIQIFKSNNGQPYDYNVTILERNQAVQSLGLNGTFNANDPLDWNTVIELQGGYRPGSQLYFVQPSGSELIGTYVINPVDPTVLVVTFDEGTLPENTFLGSVDSQNRRLSGASAGTIDAIVDPYKFNPITRENGRFLGARYLMLDDVNNSSDVGKNIDRPDFYDYDGPDAWKNLDGSDPIIAANSIIEWDGEQWITIFDPRSNADSVYVSNLRTGIQYRWDGEQWIKSFEGEYSPGYWGFIGETC
jgi:hypothetical protein